MAEYVQKDPSDLFVSDPESRELDRTEEALYLSAKSGHLLEPEMTPKEWRQFCEAAGTEEEERRSGTPDTLSRLTPEDRALLDKGGESVKSPAARKLLERRERLIKRLRPQCVDANDEAFEKELLDDLGLTAEEFKRIDKSLGPLQDWDELEKRNAVNYLDDKGGA